jgi:dTDP-4-dehydrorhamnose 3,5-epimerase-like enzyme
VAKIINYKGVIWNDPDLREEHPSTAELWAERKPPAYYRGIAWPVNNPIISDKDKQHSALKSADNNFAD